MTLRGVDLASYQGTPGQWKTEAGDIGFAAVKVSELAVDGSRYVDPDVADDVEWLRANGKGVIHYLFAHPGAPVNDTAAFFLSVLDQIGLAPGDGIAVDLETTDGKTPAHVCVWMRMLLRRLEAALKRKPLVYVDLSFAEAGNCSGLGGWPLWISNPSRPAGDPLVPAPWKTWAIHQFDISGHIDRDVAHFADLAEFRAVLGKPASQPAGAILEEPMLLAAKDVQLPVAIPAGTKALRFVAAGTAVVRIHFHTEPGTRTASLSWAAGSHEEPVPDGCHGALVTRADAGADEVSLVCTP